MLARQDDDLPVSKITGKVLARPLCAKTWQQIKDELWTERHEHNGLSWHVVRCVGKNDGYVLDWLKKCKLETYYPRVREMRPLPKRQLSPSQRNAGVEVMKPQLVALCPRYPFVRFDIKRDDWHRIFEFAGIAGMVCEGNLPVWMPNRLIERIRLREVDGAVPGKTPAKLIFAIGDQVRVTTGPFAAFPGQIETILEKSIEDVDGETRIKVAVNLFGRPTPVELEASQIEKFE